MILDPYKYVAAPPAGSYVTWQGLNLCTSFANGGLDCVGVASWGAHAYSLEEKASGFIKVEHKIDATINGSRILGLTNATSALTETYGTLDFGIFLFSTGVYTISDGVNNYPAALSGWTTDDVFAIQSNGGNIELLKKGSVIYTWTAPTINYPLKAMAFMEGTTGFRECKIYLS